MNEKPIHEIMLGPVKGAIWKNQTKHGPKFTVSYQRVYKDKDDKWQTSGVFTSDGSLILAQVAQQCALWMFQNNSAKESVESTN